MQSSALGLSISIITPAYNAEKDLAAALAALSQSKVAPTELIVVDDGSQDGTAMVAREFGARVISTKSKSGPAHARNQGARHAKGDLLLFLDADVCVHPDTIGRIVAEFEQNPDLDALMGSYDDKPTAPDLLSQYRNLLHSFIHRESNQDAKSFWAGCGAIRRTVFLEHGGFDESYTEPGIEDIELGVRLTKAGCKIALLPSIQVTHLKAWGVRRLVSTEFFHRAVPWTRLILREGSMPCDLNLRWSHRLSVALGCLMLLIVLATTASDGGQFLACSLGVVLLMMGTFWLQRISTRKSYWDRITLTFLAVSLAAYAVKHRSPVVIGSVALGYLLLLMRRRFFFSTYRARVITGRLYAVYLAVSAFLIASQMPTHRATLVVALCALGIFLLNLPFYSFFVRRSGYLHVLAVTPFHWLHYLSSGIAFVTGLGLFLFKRDRQAYVQKTPDGRLRAFERR